MAQFLTGRTLADRFVGAPSIETIQIKDKMSSRLRQRLPKKCFYVTVSTYINYEDGAFPSWTHCLLHRRNDYPAKFQIRASISDGGWHNHFRRGFRLKKEGDACANTVVAPR